MDMNHNQEAIDKARLRIVEAGLYLQHHADDFLPSRDELVEYGTFTLAIDITTHHAKIETSRSIFVPNIDRKQIVLCCE